LESLNTLNVLTAWSEIPITCDIRIFWQKLVNFYVASESFPSWNVNNISVIFSSLFPTINFFDPVVGQIFLEFGLNLRQGLLDLRHMIFHPFLTNLKNYLYKMYDVQGPRIQIDAFQMDIFSWLNDIPIKRKLFLEFWDREIWYKTFNLYIFIFLWSQSLNVWKIQWFFHLTFAAIKTKTNFLASTLQPFSRFWKNQC
jgi:hypothetical protein